MRKIYVVYFSSGRYEDLALRAFTTYKEAEKWKSSAMDELNYLRGRIEEARAQWDGEIHAQEEFFDGTKWLHENHLSPCFYESLEVWDINDEDAQYRVEELDLYGEIA